LFGYCSLEPPGHSGQRGPKDIGRRLEMPQKARYPHEPSDAESLYVRIVWFSRKKGGPDTDNIVKPILDELDGIIYRTDAQIKQCLTTRIDLTKPYAISNRDVPDDLYQSLLDLISSSHGDILFIEVGDIRSQEVVFGKIDRSGI
jgi:Endodeoxyribonuclease RusA